MISGLGVEVLFSGEAEVTVKEFSRIEGVDFTITTKMIKSKTGIPAKRSRAFLRVMPDLRRIYRLLALSFMSSTQVMITLVN